MKQNLHISVSKKPKNNSLISCKSITLRERVMKFLFGNKQRITILVPGDEIKELAITKVEERGEES